MQAASGRQRFWRRLRKRYRRFLRKTGVGRVIDYLVAVLTRGIVGWLRRLDPDSSSDFMGRMARRIGPYLPVSRVGRTNLRAAYPEKSPAEIEAILAGVWENLGRLAGEFVHLEQFWDYDDARPNAGRIETFHVDRFIRLYTDNKPALIFTAHLANWELAAVAARRYGLDSAVVFRVPNNRFIAELIQETRAELMTQLVPAGRTAGLFMGGVIERGGHLGMLVDQHRKPGVRVRFFGRPCWTSDAIARLARRYDCPVHGVRVIRLPRGRFRLELTPALALPRDAEGLVDAHAAMQMITSVIESWVREYPEQWLWLHRRWRD